ncbi:7TM domain sensor diguanylate cyclase [Paenibacillus curdlanolyticus YK9]|uniref:7TM domain sensor diguanylate cyclase n=1 Tax=Paenibacillus curdlanolyticus YK9 TaxID=717606 RepID=E0I7T4_9BACL|nr:diguanylate cyclase [Paenibacillus curdlanolyticus]EFM11239.1 7TM domain sensor diguanylate cyclase [Paenibacillus curdlanolyticus YK9]
MGRHRLLLVLVVAIALLTGCSGSITNAKEAPRATKGAMDAAQAEAASSKPIELNGEWSFYWNQLLEPEDLQVGAGQLTGYLDMPNNWNQFKRGADNLPRTGYATFVLRLNISDPEQVKGLALPVMYSNYKIWIDNQLISTSGQVGTDQASSIPQKRTNVVYFSPRSEQVQIVMQISNFHNYEGGMWEPIGYGSAEAIQSEHNWKLAEQCILLGIILLSGIYHIGLGMFYRKDASLLLFGLFCLTAAFRNTLTGEVLLTRAIPNFPWEIQMKLEYITLYVMVPLMALFIRKLFLEESSRRVTLLTVAMAAAYTLVTLIANAEIYYRLLVYYQLFVAMTLVYALFVFIWASLRKKEGAVYALVGFSFFTLTAAVDLFAFIFSSTGQVIYSVGVATFIACFAFVLSKKLASSFKMAQQLAIELAELNEGLDRKVRERTAAIAASNAKLEELNRQLQEWSMVDGLTGVSNRRHFDEYLSSQLVLSAEEGTPFTLLMIDIDFFKRYNDHYGHIQGDSILQIVVNAIQACLDPDSGGLVARYGGEEFAVILPRCGKERAKRIADEMCDSVRQLRIPHTGSEAAPFLTISIGAATAALEAEKGVKQMVQLADEHLYRAKSRGRNQVSID